MQEDNIAIALIQRELGVLNQKVTKLTHTNQYLMELLEKKKDQEVKYKDGIPISQQSVHAILLVLWTLTGEKRNADDICSLQEDILSYVPLFLENILSEISLRLQKQQLTEIDSNLIESICGIVGNLCYLPKHTILLHQSDNLLILLNSFLIFYSTKTNQSILISKILLCFDNIACVEIGRAVFHFHLVLTVETIKSSTMEDSIHFISNSLFSVIYIYYNKNRKRKDCSQKIIHSIVSILYQIVQIPINRADKQLQQNMQLFKSTLLNWSQSLDMNDERTSPFVSLFNVLYRSYFVC